MNTPITAPPAAHTQDAALLPPLVLELIAAGWEQRAPDPLTAEIDARHAAGAFCPRCRRRGLVYMPFVKGDRYRIALVCRCGAAEEA